MRKLKRLARKILTAFKSVIGYIINAFSLLTGKLRLNGGARLFGHIIVTGAGRTVLGKGVTVRSGRRQNPIGGDVRTIFYSLKGAVIRIGDGTGLSNTAIVAQGGVTIGSGVRIGNSVKIYDSDFHSIDPERRLTPETDDAVIMPVLIKDRAFIGAHSIILKGVTIGENSVVGAGSVVTKSIPDNEIWGGAPAKFIKKLESCGK